MIEPVVGDEVRDQNDIVWPVVAVDGAKGLCILSRQVMTTQEVIADFDIIGPGARRYQPVDKGETA